MSQFPAKLKAIAYFLHQKASCLTCRNGLCLCIWKRLPRIDAPPPLVPTHEYSPHTYLICSATHGQQLQQHSQAIVKVQVVVHTVCDLLELNKLVYACRTGA